MPRTRTKAGTPEPEAAGHASLESASLRLFNSIVEPLVRAGFASPAPCHAGLIVLETIGRRSGNTHRTPVIAGEAGGHLWVTTARGDRSDWVRNARTNPDVRYWLYGQEREATAFVFGADGSRPDLRGLPARTRRVATQISSLAGGAGFAFAILVPKPIG